MKLNAGKNVRLASIPLLVACLLVSADDALPRFDGKQTLLRPSGYREWVFVGSSLGVRYDPEPSAKSSANAGQTNELDFKNVYINPRAYREFSKTGKFPDGTILLLEIASAATKSEPGLQGSFQKDFLRLEAAVKDSKRFDDAWAYFSFTEKPGRLKDKAEPFRKASCFDCHHEKAAIDNVFTQFYPVLRAVAQK